MDVQKVIETLKSNCIDDPEDLLDWLIDDGLKILEEYVGLKKKADMAYLDRPRGSVVNSAINTKAGFRLVYEGHNHDVWCNGSLHHKSWFSLEERKMVEKISACDCYLYE